MALLDEVRTALRVSGKGMDGEIRLWVDAALADMRRVGIDPALTDGEVSSPLVRAAVVCYAKARFGYDVEERPQFESSYRSCVCDLLHSTANTAARDG